MAGHWDKHQKVLIDNAIRKIDRHVIDIKERVSTSRLVGAQSRYLSEALQSAFVTYCGDRQVFRQPDLGLDDSPNIDPKHDVIEAIEINFHRTHELLTSINDAAIKISRDYWQRWVIREIEFLKAIRALRRHLDIPYDLHESLV